MVGTMESNRRSLDLSSLDDIPEDRAYTKGEESNRVDSGLGEWESCSSRKTSVSSQGSRFSPEINETKEKEVVKRRRSGIDMINKKPPVLMQGQNQTHQQIVTTRLPRIPRTSRSSGIWSRKVSPAGLEYLKMDDEMEEVMRNGLMVLVPRKISDHIPTVPINSTDRFLTWEWNENLDMEDEDLKIYKTPVTDIYMLHKHKWEFFGKHDFRKTMLQAMDGDKWMSGQQKFDLMKGFLSEKEQKKMEKMLSMGFSHDDVVSHFMEEAEKEGGFDLRKKMDEAMKEKNMTDEEMLETLKGQMDEQSLKEMEEMLARGESAEDVVKKMMNQGSTKEEGMLEKAETLNHLLKTKKKIRLTDGEAEDMIDERFDEDAKGKLKKGLKSGKTLKQSLKDVISEAKPEDNMTEMERKIKKLTEGKNMSQYDMYELIRDQMDDESRKKMEELVKNGMPLEEAIEFFLKKGKTAEQAQNEKSEMLREMLENSAGMDQDGILEMMRGELSKKDLAQLEKMLANGCSKQEVIDHFLNRGKDDGFLVGKTEFQEKMDLLLEGKNLSDDEVLALMRGQLDEKGKQEIAEMLAKGYSKKDIINHMMKNVKTEQEKQQEEVMKLANLFNENDFSEEEKISMLEKQLSPEDKKKMEEMLKNGCPIEEVIQHFMSRAMSPECEKTAFAKSIEKMTGGKAVNQDQMLALIAENLDTEQQEKMSEMLAKGYSKQDVIDYFLKNAKTKEEQMKITAEKIKALMNDDKMTEQDKLEMLKNQLSKEDFAQMEALLKDGGSVDDVVSKLLKSKSTDSLSDSELSRAVHELIDGRDLSKEDIIDIIKGQIDEDSLRELENMLKKGFSPQEVIDHFLSNGKTIQEARRMVSNKIKAIIHNIECSPKEKLELIQDVLMPADIKQIERLLSSGMSMEEVLEHFSDRSTKDGFANELSKRVKKLSNGKPLPPDQMLELIKRELGEAGKKELEAMTEKGFNPQDLVEYFLEKGKTKDQEKGAIGRKLGMIQNMSGMSQEEIMNVLDNNLSEQEQEAVREMLRSGKTIEQVLKELADCAEANTEETISDRIKKLSGNRKLSTEEMYQLIKENICDEQKDEMAKMIASGMQMEDVVKYFMENGTARHIDHAELTKRLDSLIDMDTMSEEEIKDILNAQLSGSDKKEMEFMLKNGCSIEEVVAYFMCRGREDGETELATRVKKLSNGKSLSDADMIELIKDQLGEEGRAKLETMLKEGISSQEIIDYFMINGKTEHEEYKEVSQKIGKLIQKRKLSKEDIKDILESNLGEIDKAKMSALLAHGCTYDEILQHFLIRGSSPERSKTEMAKRVRKMSRGKGFTKKEIIDIIKLQLTQESQEDLDKMLDKGYYEEDIITYYMIKGKTCDEEFREIARKLSNIIDPSTMSEDQILEIIKDNVGQYDKAQVEEMLRCGCTTPEILNLFLNRGKMVEYQSELFKQIQKLVEGKVMHPLDLIEMIKEIASQDLLDEIPKLLEKGYTVQDVIEYALKYGKTQDEKDREVAEKMLGLLRNNMSEAEAFELMKSQLGKAGRKKMEELLKKGFKLRDVLDLFLDTPAEEEKEEESEFSLKIKELIGDKQLSTDEMLALVKSQLDISTQLQIDEMLRKGATKEEIIKHFMTRENNKKGQKKSEFGKKIYELTKGSKMSKREIIMLMKGHLDPESVEKMEDMINKCYPLEDIIDYFLKHGKTPDEAKKEKELQKEKAKRETNKKLRKMIDGNNLSNEEILAILKLQMGDEDKAQLELMIKQGCSPTEIINHFMNRDVSDDEGEPTLFEKKMYDLMDGKNMSNEDILDMMKNELDDESVQQMEEMLKKGYSKEDVIKYFMKHGDKNNEFAQEMKALTGNNDMTKEELLEVMKNKVGVLCQRKIDDMLREGYSLDEIIEHVMTHGRTQEQETKFFKRRMSQLLDEKTLTDQEKVEMLKQNLGKEAASMVEELMKNGLTEKNIMYLFMKYGDNLNSLVKDEFFIKELKFPDEPPDAHKHTNRSVFHLINKEESKKILPFMSPSGKVHIFGLFFEKVLMLIDGKDLTHREILDLMRSRMGACYAKEFDELRSKGLSLQEIVDYFLQRDGETIVESRLVAKLKADARVDSRVYLKRTYSKEKWGINLTYTFSKDHGLHLIMKEVVEKGPAWESGVRPGDIIVTVNDWLIVLMDRPQVAAHLFQAGANIVKLGIQKSRGSSPERYLGLY